MRWRIRSQPTIIDVKGVVYQTIASGIGHLKTIKPNQLLDTKDNYFAYPASHWPSYICSHVGPDHKSVMA